MKVVTLVENTTSCENIGRVHGLSIYAETPKHRLLIDMGPNALFLENAEKLGIDISSVDTAIISHGHYDHAGGLPLFCKRNELAKIYINRLAFGEYYAREADGGCDYIGVPKDAGKFSGRFVMTEKTKIIDDELMLFSNIATNDYLSSSNRVLIEKNGDERMPDKFLHEQNLIVTCENKKILFAGCAHRGIVNILRRAEEISGCEMDYVFGGFHLTNPGCHTDEPRELVEEIGNELKKRKTIYVTGHCTGKGPFAILKEQLGPQIEAMSSGRIMEI